NRAIVDRWVTVDEEQIAEAMRLYMRSEQHVIEGAAGVAIAGMLESADEIAGRNVLVLICGGNIATQTLNQLE
ncbi:MAG: pyridoxal-phosphate dependent enzyme, partial [Planctomycetes bacterium]|nr:pyridoxal-phosphate dependent enzyme [Planctomycetota bacterium]